MWLEPLIVRLLNALVRRPQPKTPTGVLLGRRTDGVELGLPVVWPEARILEHCIVVGATGAGKSHSLLHTAHEHMRQGRGMCFIDCHGDAANQLVNLAALQPDADERLVIFDPTSATESPGINPLELSGDDFREAFTRASELTSILRQRWNVDSFGARSEELLRAVLFTAAVHGLTLVDVPLILTSAHLRQRLAARLPSPDIKSYWQDRFEPLSEAMKGVFREPLLNKITAFIVDPGIRHILGQVRSTVNFSEAMQQGRWVIINLAKGVMREHAVTLGNLLLAKLQFDIMARSRIPPRERRPFAIICDEVQNFAENDLATLFTESRKFACSLTTANQYWDQLPQSLRGALLASGTHMFFRLSATDAGTLAPELSVTNRQRYVAELTNLPRGHAIVRIGTDAPATLRVPSLPTITPAAIARSRHITSLSASRYARARTDIEADITRRQRTLHETPQTLTNTSHHEHFPREGQTDW